MVEKGRLWLQWLQWQQGLLGEQRRCSNDRVSICLLGRKPVRLGQPVRLMRLVKSCGREPQEAREDCADVSRRGANRGRA